MGALRPTARVMLGAWAAVLMGCAATTNGSVGSARDAGMDAVNDDARSDVGDVVDVAMVPDMPITVPRLIRPFSNMIATHRRPELRWELPSGVSDVIVRICRDRACSTIEHTLPVTGTRVRPPEDLAPGVHFWNVEASGDGGALRSHTWAFRTLNGQREVDTTWEGGADFNGDGLTDIVIVRRDDSTPMPTSAVDVFYGRRDRAPRSMPDATVWPGFSMFGTLRGLTQPSGDIDGDGFSDLIVATGLKEWHRRVVFRGGLSGIAAEPTWWLRRDERLNNVGGFVGDIDGDGRGEILFTEVAPRTSMNASVRLLKAGIVNGAWSTADLGVSESDARAISAAADFDGDGLHDVAMSTFGERPIVLYGPVRADSRRYAYDLQMAFGVALIADLQARCDFDGDGISDILAEYSGSPAPDQLRGYRLALFPSRPMRDAIEVPNPLSVLANEIQCPSDFDGDGSLEAVSQRHNTVPPRLAMHRYVPQSRHFDEVDFGASPAPSCRFISAMGDYDGDGFGDIACLGETDGARRSGLSIIFGSASSRWDEAYMVGYAVDFSTGPEIYF